MKCRNRTPCERCGGTDAVVVHRFRGSTVSERCLSCSDGTQECGAVMEVCERCDGDRLVGEAVGNWPAMSGPCPTCSGTGYVCPRCQGAGKETAMERKSEETE